MGSSSCTERAPANERPVPVGGGGELALLDAKLSAAYCALAEALLADDDTGGADQEAELFIHKANKACPQRPDHLQVRASALPDQRMPSTPLTTSRRTDQYAPGRKRRDLEVIQRPTLYSYSPTDASSSNSS